ncbi:glycoside hydrolase family 114 protein [Gonapodya prolifera JEL478]|uniref:alpha-galactosidase n=1 Tax=Gonapodya prolifera (strain JEL478) TaxID=1344416 RepID=A0A139AMW3_GONPJ|nr:glycoside hydrolase family 114 protein [Gonapodya prolifera JEL478]|eukprot:KXS18092.1 glycoside hydrolase family 114 protein [Gonapodya prolifera JEL478]
MFATTVAQINTLKLQGQIVICYFSAGSYENWRPNINVSPTNVIGKPMVGWPGEFWLDIRQMQTLGSIMRNGMLFGVQKGCDGRTEKRLDLAPQLYNWFNFAVVKQCALTLPVVAAGKAVFDHMTSLNINAQKKALALSAPQTYCQTYVDAPVPLSTTTSSTQTPTTTTLHVQITNFNDFRDHTDNNGNNNAIFHDERDPNVHDHTDDADHLHHLENIDPD